MAESRPGACAVFAEDLAEVALAVREPFEVPGLEAHLDGCASCREDLDELSATADRLVLVASEAEPPRGLCTGAVAAIRRARSADGAIAGASPASPASWSLPATGAMPSIPARPARSRVAVAALVAAAVVLVLLATGVRLVAGGSDGQPQPQAAAPTGHPVGRAGHPAVRLVATDGSTAGGLAVSEGSAPAMTVWLDGARPGVDYRCEVVLADGTRHLVGTWRPSSSYRSWTVALGAPAGEVRRVEVSLTDGTPVASAALPE